MANGPVYTNIEWEKDGADPTEKTLVLAYCGVDGSDHDDLLERMFNAAKRRADEYLNNPFEVLNPTVVFDTVVADDYIVVNGKTYTVKATADEDALYFALGVDDSETADNFCTYVNSTTLGGTWGATGVEGVLAANSEGTVTFTRRYGNPDDIVVTSSDEDKLLVRQVRTLIDIPVDVNQWIYQYVRRHFRNRSALMMDTPAGIGSEMYVSMKSEESGMTENWDLIRHLRFSPGL